MKNKNILLRMKAFVDTVGISVPIWKMKDSCGFPWYNKGKATDRLASHADVPTRDNVCVEGYRSPCDVWTNGNEVDVWN